jgi:hypothetical protein
MARLVNVGDAFRQQLAAKSEVSRGRMREIYDLNVLKNHQFKRLAGDACNLIPLSYERVSPFAYLAGEDHVIPVLSSKRQGERHAVKSRRDWGTRAKWA